MLLCGDEEERVSTESGGRSVEEIKNYFQDKIKLILDQKSTALYHCNIHATATQNIFCFIYK